MTKLDRRLTKSLLDSLEPESGKEQSFYGDTDLIGFGVRVSRTGAKSYVVKLRHSGAHADDLISIFMYCE